MPEAAGSLKIEFSGSIPGEQIIVAALNYAQTVRQTMDPALLKRQDQIAVEMQEFWWNQVAKPILTSAAQLVSVQK